MGFLLTRLPLVCGIVFALAAFAFSCWQWWTFRYATFDLAFYVQALWLALRGEWQVSLLNVPLLGNHAEPIVFLALPLFAIWPHPMLLIALQTAALATMPSTAWRIARVLAIPPAGAVLLALAVVITPATGFVALHEFHPEALAAPLLLLLIEARLKERRSLFWIWFLLALGCKENIALLLVAWCFIHVIVDWRRPRTWQIHWNILPLFVAAGWCAIYAAFISPALNPGNVDYLELYSHLGKTTGEIAAGFFTNPQRILSAIHRALFGGNLVWALLLPFLALPILRPHWLLIAAPVLLQHLLSWRPSEWSIEAHYAAPLIPLFWIATAEAIARARLRTTIAALICLATLGAHAWIGPARVIARELARSSERVVERQWKAELLQAISPGASVTAGVPYLSHLATRDELHSLHHLLKGLKTLSRSTYQPPPATDAVVVDYADTATFSVHSGYYHPQMRTEDLRIVPSSDRLLHDFLAQKAWVERSRNAFHIYLAGTRDDLAVKADPTPVLIAQGSALTAVEVSPIGGVDSFQMRMQWQFEDARELFPWAMLILSDGERAYTILKGAAAVAFPSGEAREHWNVTLPATFPSGEYRLTLIFYNHMLAAWQGKLPPRDGSFIFRTIDLGTRRLTNGKLGEKQTSSRP